MPAMVHDHKTPYRPNSHGLTYYCNYHLCSNKCLPQLKQSWNLKVYEIIKTLFLILFYYLFSIGLTFYNKWMFKRFHFPLMTTSIHFLTVFILSSIARTIFSKCHRSPVTLGWMLYLKKVFVTGNAFSLIGIVSALDIGLSNWSFVFITVSLYTMVKSTCVIFILGFALVLKLEKPRFSLIIVVCLIAGGLFLFVFESSQFNLEGFILVLTASFLGGIRWTLSQLLTQKKEIGLGNPIDLLYHLQPTMFVGLFPLALVQEGLPFFASRNIFAWEAASDFVSTVTMIGVGGALAFMLSYSEYLLLCHTSSLTLSISGIFKEIITLIMATTHNHNQLAPLNWLGFFICLSGISLHVFLKFTTEDTDDVSKSDADIRMNALQDHLQALSDSETETELFNIRDST